MTTAVLNTKIDEAENKIYVSGLVQKTDYDAKTSDIEEKELLHKSNISNLVKNSDLNTKLATLATRAELKAEQDKIVKHVWWWWF